MGQINNEKSETARPSRRAPNRYPERFTIRLTAGSRARIAVAAEHDDMAPTEWVRTLIRKGLDAARKRRERAAKGPPIVGPCDLHKS